MDFIINNAEFFYKLSLFFLVGTGFTLIGGGVAVALAYAAVMSFGSGKENHVDLDRDLLMKAALVFPWLINAATAALQWIRSAIANGSQYAVTALPYIVGAFAIGIFAIVIEEFQPEIMSWIDNMYGCFFSVPLRNIVFAVLNILRLIFDLAAWPVAAVARSSRYVYRDLPVLLFSCATSNLPAFFEAFGNFFAEFFIAIFQWVFEGSMIALPLDFRPAVAEINVMGAITYDILYCFCEQYDYLWNIVAEVLANENLQPAVFYATQMIIFPLVEFASFITQAPGPYPPQVVPQTIRPGAGLVCLKIDMDPFTGAPIPPSIGQCYLPQVKFGLTPVSCLNTTCSGLADPSFPIGGELPCSGEFCRVFDDAVGGPWGHGPPNGGVFFEYACNFTQAAGNYIDEVVGNVLDQYLGQIILLPENQPCVVGSFADFPCLDVVNGTYGEGCILPILDNVVVECELYFDCNKTGNITNPANFTFVDPPFTNETFGNESGLCSGVRCSLVGCDLPIPQISVDLQSIRFPNVSCLLRESFCVVFNFLNVTVEIGLNAPFWFTIDDRTSSISKGGLPYWKFDSVFDALIRYFDCPCEYFDFIGRVLGTIENLLRTTFDLEPRANVEDTRVYRLINGVCCAIFNLVKMFVEFGRLFVDLFFGTFFGVANGDDFDTYAFERWGDGTLENSPIFVPLLRLSEAGFCLGDALAAFWEPLRCLGELIPKLVVVLLTELINIFFAGAQATQLALLEQEFTGQNLTAIPCNVFGVTNATDCFFQGVTPVECASLNCSVALQLCNGIDCDSTNDPFNVTRMPCSNPVSPTMATGCRYQGTLPVTCASYNCSLTDFGHCAGIDCTYNGYGKTLASIDGPFVRIIDGLREIPNCIRDIIWALHNAIFEDVWGVCEDGEITSLPFVSGEEDIAIPHYSFLCCLGRFISNAMNLVLDVYLLIVRVILVIFSQDKPLAQTVSLSFDDVITKLDFVVDDTVCLFSPWHYWIPPNLACPEFASGFEFTFKSVWVRTVSVLFTIIGDILNLLFTVLDFFINDVFLNVVSILNGEDFFDAFASITADDFVDIFKAVTDVIFGYIVEVTRAFANFLDCLLLGLGDIPNAFADLIEAVASLITDFFLDLLQLGLQGIICMIEVFDTGNTDNPTCDDFLAGALALIADIGSLFLALLLLLKDLIITILTSIFEVIQNLIAAIGNIIQGLCTILEDILNGFINVLNAIPGVSITAVNLGCEPLDPIFLKRSTGAAATYERHQQQFSTLHPEVKRQGLLWEVAGLVKRDRETGLRPIDLLNYKSDAVRELAISPTKFNDFQRRYVDSQYEDLMLTYEHGFDNGSLPATLWAASINTTQIHICNGILNRYATASWENMTEMERLHYADCGQKMTGSLAFRAAFGIEPWANSDITFNTWSMVEFLGRATSSVVAWGRWYIDQEILHVVDDEPTNKQCLAQGVDMPYLNATIAREARTRTKQWYFDQYSAADMALADHIFNWALDFAPKLKNATGLAVKSLLGSGATMAAGTSAGGGGQLVLVNTTHDELSHMGAYLEVAQCVAEAPRFRNGSIARPVQKFTALLGGLISGWHTSGMNQAIYSTWLTSSTFFTEVVLGDDDPEMQMMTKRNAAALVTHPRTVRAAKAQSHMRDMFASIYSAAYKGATRAYMTAEQEFPLIAATSEKTTLEQLYTGQGFLPISTQVMPVPRDLRTEFDIRAYLSRLSREGYARSVLRRMAISERRPVDIITTAPGGTHRLSARDFDLLREAQFPDAHRLDSAQQYRAVLEAEYGKRADESMTALHARAGQQRQLNGMARTLIGTDSEGTARHGLITYSNETLQRINMQYRPHTREAAEEERQIALERTQAAAEVEMLLNHIPHTGVYNMLTHEFESEPDLGLQSHLGSYGLFHDAARPSQRWDAPQRNERELLHAYNAIGVPSWQDATEPHDLMTTYNAYDKRFIPQVFIGSVATVIIIGALGQQPGGLPGTDPAFSFGACNQSDPRTICQGCAALDLAVEIFDEVIGAANLYYGTEFPNGPLIEFTDFWSDLKDEYLATRQLFNPTPSILAAKSTVTKRTAAIGRRYSPSVAKIWSREHLYRDTSTSAANPLHPNIYARREARKRERTNIHAAHNLRQGRQHPDDVKRIHEHYDTPLPTAMEFYKAWWQFLFPRLSGIAMEDRVRPRDALWPGTEFKKRHITPRPSADHKAYGWSNWNPSDPYSDYMTEQARRVQWRNASTVRAQSGNMLHKRSTNLFAPFDYTTRAIPPSSPFFGEPSANEPFRDLWDALFGDIDTSVDAIFDFITNTDENDPDGLLFYVTNIFTCEDFENKFLCNERNFSLGQGIIVLGLGYGVLFGGLNLAAGLYPGIGVILTVVNAILRVLVRNGFIAFLMFGVYNFGAACSAGFAWTSCFPDDVFNLFNDFFQACYPWCDDIIDFTRSDPDVACRVCFAFREFLSCRDDKGFLDGTDNILYTLQVYYPQIVANIATGTGGWFYSILNSFSYVQGKAAYWTTISEMCGFNLCNYSLGLFNIAILFGVILIYGAFLALVNIALVVIVVSLGIAFFLSIYTVLTFALRVFMTARKAREPSPRETPASESSAPGSSTTVD